MSEIEHAAIVEISSKLLLDILDFGGGTVIDVRKPHEVWKPDYIEIVIEHPDMPKVKPAEKLQRIVPMYRQVYERQRIVTTRIEPENLKTE